LTQIGRFLALILKFRLYRKRIPYSESASIHVRLNPFSFFRVFTGYGDLKSNVMKSSETYMNGRSFLRWFRIWYSFSIKSKIEKEKKDAEFCSSWWYGESNEIKYLTSSLMQKDLIRLQKRIALDVIWCATMKKMSGS
jgi:hypothetical protein